MIYQPITNPDDKCGAIAQDPFIKAIVEKTGMYEGEVIIWAMVNEGILEPQHINPVIEGLVKRLQKSESEPKRLSPYR